jgi:EmrB/QacA subfamily drug resistance transporter
MQAAPRRNTRWRTLWIVGLGVAIGPLDTAVNIAFPAITAAFRISLPTIQWVIICYVLTYASLLLGCGRLGDIVGHRRVFLFGLGWSAISLLLCGLAPTFGWFLLFRALQGVGTALVFSCAPALVTLAFPEAERGKALGLYNMVSAAAFALGPLVGGVLVAHWGWPVVYFFRAPLALLSAVCMWLLVRQAPVIKPGQRFDTSGALSLTLTLAGLLLAFNRAQHLGWLSLLPLLLCAGAGSCLGFFLWHELHCAEPVIDLRLFRHGAFTIANVANILANVAGFTILLLVPYYLLNYQRIPAAAGGLLLAMGPLGSVLASPVSGVLLQRLPAHRLSLGGLLLMTIGLASISQWHGSTPTLCIAGALWLQGFGLGLFQVANMDVVMGSIPRFQQGVAGGLTMLTRTLGTVGCVSMGAMTFGWLQTSFTSQFQAAGLTVEATTAQAFVLAFQWVFRGAVVVAAITCILMWSTRFVSRHTPRTAATDRPQ